MGGDARESAREAFERFRGEAEKAGGEACRGLARIFSEKPWFPLVLAETLPVVVDSWAQYVEGLAGYLGGELRGRVLDELGPGLAGFLAGVYGVDAGVYLALLAMLPAGVFVEVLSKCGAGLGEEEAVRLRVALAYAHSTVYRVYFELWGSGDGGGEPPFDAGSLII